MMTVIVLAAAFAAILGTWLVAYMLREHGPLDEHPSLVPERRPVTADDRCTISGQTIPPPIQRRFAIGWGAISDACRLRGTPSRMFVGTHVWHQLQALHSGEPITLEIAAMAINRELGMEIELSPMLPPTGLCAQWGDTPIDRDAIPYLFSVQM
jgi:hypothetical protein